MMTHSIDYLPYAIAFVIAIPFFILLRQFIHLYADLKERELQALGIKAGNDARFQSFERMTLFLDRIKPANLVHLFDKNLAPHEYVYLAEKTIQEEFDYNTSQQIFLSNVNWQNIVNAKDQMIKLLHSTYQGINSNATLEDFKAVFLMNYMNEGDFVNTVLEELKKELLILNFKA